MSTSKQIYRSHPAQTLVTRRQEELVPTTAETPQLHPQKYSTVSTQSKYILLDSKTRKQKEKDFDVEDDESDNFLKKIGVNMNMILESQNELIERQTKIFDELASQRAILEFIFEIYNPPSNQPSSTDAIFVSKTDMTTNLLPVDSIEKADELEQLLSEEGVMNQLILKMSPICGSSGNICGINCCYALIDRFFNRDFLTQCSWSGGSRNTEGKVPFIKYKNIMKAIHKTVTLTDPQFSEIDCQNFFKRILKNARQRAQIMYTTERKRFSSGKNRPKNLKYRKSGTDHQVATDSFNIASNTNINKISNVEGEYDNMYADDADISIEEKEEI